MKLFVAICCGLLVAINAKAVFEENVEDELIQTPEGPLGPIRFAKPEVDENIVGGSVAVPHSAPYYGVLLRGGRFICGCSLIHRSFVLTAAHCITVTNARAYQVALGKHNLNEEDDNQQVIGVSNVLGHDEYRGRPDFWRNDIGLLKLSAQATINRWVQITSLWANQNNLLVGRPSTLYGFGRVRAGGSVASQLKTANFTVLDTQACARSMGNGIVLYASSLCAESSSASACSGDSGGPKVLSDANGTPQIALTSFGFSNCPRGRPGVYTRVSFYSQWIATTIRENL